MDALKTPPRHVIDGRLVEPDSPDLISVVNPATETVVGQVPVGTAADVDAAVRAAARALRSSAWSDLTAKDRADMLRRLSRSFLDHADDIVRTVSTESGAVLDESYRLNVDGPLRLYEYYGGLAEAMQVEEVRDNLHGHHTIVRQEPVGVCALITAWNAPQAIVSMKLGPALAAGCTAVIKPAPETPFDSYLFMDLVRDAGIPDGVVNIVFGDADTGRELIRHPGVQKVSFTGSAAAGREIARTCGELLKPVTLELGGKSAAILLDDVDLDVFLPLVSSHCLANAGQICALSTRILAPRGRYDEIIEGLAATMSSWVVGDPFDPRTQLGPVVAERQRDRIEGLIKSGVDQGARIVTGGGRPAGLDRGWYVEPTLFTDVDNSMRIAQEEIFGPVLSVIPYSDENEAVAIANASDYGLGGTVFTRDDERGTDVARRVETGSIGVNLYGQFEDAPFGGVKQSGFGRELGPEAMVPYLVTKSIYRTGPSGG